MIYFVMDLRQQGECTGIPCLGAGKVSDMASQSLLFSNTSVLALDTSRGLIVFSGISDYCSDLL